MCQPIEQGARQPLGTEHVRPILEQQVRGDDAGAALIAPREHLKQQFDPVNNSGI